MGNKGRIVVFLSMLLAVFLLLGITAIQIVSLYCAKAKTAMCARLAISEVKSTYNSYIFEHYHILLFDRNCGGRGEGAIEENIIKSMQNNLGRDYKVNDAVIGDITGITDNGCAKLKEQIVDYIPYAGVEYGVEQILELTDGRDGALPKELVQDMDEAEISTENTIATTEESKSDKENRSEKKSKSENNELGNDSKKQSGKKQKDPRKFTGSLTNKAIMALVVPEDIELSDRILTENDVMSVKYIGILGDSFSINNSFNNYDNLKKDLDSHSKWKEGLLEAGCGVAYASQVFNNALNRDNNSESVLSCEQEYLITGLDTDYKNLSGVVRKLIAIRLPVDFAYILSDSQKNSQVEALAASLSVAAPVAEKIIKYLLAGCWAFAESVAEVRYLLGGNCMDFTKNDKNWITDLNDLKGTISNSGIEEEGLSYEDYLMILMSMSTDKIYYRMLDIMQLNARQADEGFCIEKAATALSVDVNVSFGGRQFLLREDGGY